MLVQSVILFIKSNLGIAHKEHNQFNTLHLKKKLKANKTSDTVFAFNDDDSKKKGLSVTELDI